MNLPAVEEVRPSLREAESSAFLHLLDQALGGLAPNFASLPPPPPARPAGSEAPEAVVERIVQWAARAAVSEAAARGVVHFRLLDHRLGRIDIRVRVRGRRVSVQVTGFELPEAQVAAALEERGLQLVDFLSRPPAAPIIEG